MDLAIHFMDLHGRLLPFLYRYRFLAFGRTCINSINATSTALIMTKPVKVSLVISLVSNYCRRLCRIALRSIFVGKKKFNHHYALLFLLSNHDFDSFISLVLIIYHVALQTIDSLQLHVPSIPHIPSFPILPSCSSPLIPIFLPQLLCRYCYIKSMSFPGRTAR